ncbi:RNA-binding S4 domain-containing protein [Rhizobiales bacterium]|uniref:S4 domain-containing protein n=1 Tax=Hongsoonwoonella zoysiae TaxID=2821844 RepID=UPI00155F69E4|nr:RNA-binding S4 domain-containing protein [Hongsoonwoonella zoysiae]
MSEAASAQRIDKWLWHARVTKSRSLAQKLAVSGHVRLNREKVDAASKTVKVGDVLTVALERRVLVLKILAIGSRRGPAAEARLLYEDLSPPKPARPAGTTPADGRREAGAGRPTKKERRQIDAFRRSED